jgi:methionyl-tRNA formyltransferase
MGWNVIQPARVRDAAFVESIRGARPDVIAVVAYGRLLTQAVLDAAPHGAVNLHFSLLPELRGAAPVAWALARGAQTTGVTTFRLDAGLDTGGILKQHEVAIEPGEHAPSLLDRLAHAGAGLLVDTLAGLESRSLQAVPQDHARATLAPLLTRKDGWWTPAWSAAELEGRVRGFDPWPGVWVLRGGKRLRLVDVRTVSGSTGEAPGTVLAIEDDAVRLACAAGTLAAIAAVQPEGRRPMSARDAWNGRQLGAGDRLVAVESEA